MRAVHTLAAIAMTGVLAIGTGAPAQAAAPVPVSTALGAAKPSQSPAGGASMMASRQAVASGGAVVVSELTTSTSLTLALPSGVMRRELSTVPVRVRRGGDWVPVSTDLHREGDWLVPVASAASVRFSPGGSEVLSQTQTSSGEWVSESWAGGALPVPSVEGDTATYAEVLPGVDLKLVATKTGMASIYVVKSESAAKGSGLANLQIAVGGAELVSPDQGRVAAVAADGSSLIAAQPLWWDSSGGGTYREPGGEAPPAPVTHEMTADVLTMNVGASVMVEEARETSPVQYPVFVDPDWSTDQADSWYTDAAFPNASYLTAGASDVLRVGAYAQYRSDMFFEFALEELAGKRVLDATLNTTQVAVAACGVGPITSHLVTVLPTGYTWNQEQAWRGSGDMWWSGAIESWTGPDCGAGPTAVEWGMTGEVQDLVDQGDDWVHFGFTGSGVSRRHFSREALLVVEYNSPPDDPTDPVFTSPAMGCTTTRAAAPSVGATSVTVQVNQADPDPGNVSTDFYLAKASKLGSPVQKVVPPLAAQGVQSATFGGLVDGVTYAWRAQGSDWDLDSAGFSPWCYFTVDTTKPPVPSVSTGAASFTVGSPVTVLLSGASDVAGYTYWVTPTAVTSPAPSVPVDGTVSTMSALPDCNGRVTANVRWACGNGTTAVPVTVAPTDSLSTLWVSAYDRAGNQSGAKGLLLATSGSALAASANVDAGHEWQVTSMSSPLPGTVADSNPWIGANAVDLVIPSSVGATATSLIDPPGASPVLKTGPLLATNDYIRTSAAPVNATNSFTLSMWVQVPAVPSADQVIAQQAGTGRGSVQLKVTSTGKYSFCLLGAPAADDNGRLVSNCAAGGTVTAGSWQMITGVWDAPNKQLRLLMGSSAVPVATVGHVVGSGDWSANGPLILGPSPDANRFPGLVANPAVLPAVIDQYQLRQLASFLLPFTE